MPRSSFWHDKSPCWDILGCPEEVLSECIAHREPERPCWEHSGTQCERVLGLSLECDECKVFKLYGGRGQ